MRVKTASSEMIMVDMFEILNSELNQDGPNLGQSQIRELMSNGLFPDSKRVLQELWSAQEVRDFFDAKADEYRILLNNMST